MAYGIRLHVWGRHALFTRPELKVERSSYLKIRLDILYSVYIVFSVAVVARYAWALVGAITGRQPEEVDVTRTTSGL